MFFFYNFLINISYPIYAIIIYLRTFIGKEDKKRFIEKILISKKKLLNKNNKKIIWFHSASIGEIKSIIPVIKELLKNKNYNIILTSVTLSSSIIFRKEFKKNKNIFHRFLPFDKKSLVQKFLFRWSPNLIIFVDSEIWPNFFQQINIKNIPLILLNARITNKTMNKWLVLKKFSNKVFSFINLSLASSLSSYKNLKKLGVKKIKYFGNLKFILKPDKNIKFKNSTIRSLKNIKVWSAAITHSGEDEVCLLAHKKVLAYFKNSLLIIIPRHISRTSNIQKKSNQLNFKTQVLNKETVIKKGTQVVIVNYFGSIQKYYSCSNSVFIGKSLLNKFRDEGGQNPLEAVYQGCKIYYGPFVYNFKEIYEYLSKKSLAKKTINSHELSKELIKDLQKSKRINSNRSKEIQSYGSRIFKLSVNELKKYL